MNEISAPAVARDAAVCMLEHSQRRDVPPITEVYAQNDSVNLKVCPTSREVWDRWCRLLRVDTTKAVWERGMVTARGSWNGTDVFLTGLDSDRWWSQ